MSKQKLTNGRNRNRVVFIRLTDDEYAAVVAAAELDRRNATDWSRLALLDAASKKTTKAA